MKLKTLMILKFVVCLVFAVLLLIVPKFLLTLMGGSPGPTGLVMAREYGAALVGSMLLTWYARDAGPSKARRAIVLDLFIYDAVGIFVILSALLSGVLNWLGWGIVVIYVFFTAGYGYFWFTEKQAS